MIVRSLVLTHYTVPACDGLSHARMADRAAERDRNETKKISEPVLAQLWEEHT